MEKPLAHEQKASTIMILGGGVSGALTAFHLHRLNDSLRITVVEPAVDLGLGLAYSTPSHKHLLNVPAGKISALPDEPDHFLEWLKANGDGDATATTFAPRAVFGQYVRSMLTNCERSIEHLRAKAVDCCSFENGAKVTLDDGRELLADFIVIATGNLEPATLPGVSKAAIEAGVYCHNAWDPEIYRGLPADAPVVLIGSGLTAIDVVLRLRECRHRGVITMVSRQGVLPARHAEYTPLAEPAIPPGTRATCKDYLRTLRSAIHAGTPWRAAIDSLRAVTNELWLALPLKEQKWFRRYLQRRWDTARHRMAPSIADVIEQEFRLGDLILRKGQFRSVAAVEEGARVTIRNASGEDYFVAARVINCTGPNLDYEQSDSQLLKTLLVRGNATPGPLGGGLNTTADGALIGGDDFPSRQLFTLGPLRQGTLLESVAIPEIREQAIALAGHLVIAAAQSRKNVAA